MRKLIFCLSVLLNIVLGLFLLTLFQQSKNLSDYFNSEKYAIENNEQDTSSIFFIGNSITANWINKRPHFFSENRISNKAIGGQTSTQILLRFQKDIVTNNPKLVVLNVGINDIGEGDGFYEENFTVSNIQTMIDICKANNIHLIMTSVLPATSIEKRFGNISDLQNKIQSLNERIVELCNFHNLQYVNYYNSLTNNEGGFNKNFTFDGIHPNSEGYVIMESLVLEFIKISK